MGNSSLKNKITEIDIYQTAAIMSAVRWYFTTLISDYQDTVCTSWLLTYQNNGGNMTTPSIVAWPLFGMESHINHSDTVTTSNSKSHKAQLLTDTVTPRGPVTTNMHMLNVRGNDACRVSLIKKNTVQ